MSLFYRFQAILYKILLCLLVVGVVVYLLPRAGSFQYEIQAGKPWQYETLLAPYDFPIQKTQVELEEERTRLKANIPRYFSVSPEVVPTVMDAFDQYVAGLPASEASNALFINWRTTIEAMYEIGVVSFSETLFEEEVALVNSTRKKNIKLGDLYADVDVKNALENQLTEAGLGVLSDASIQYSFSLITPNVSYDEALTAQFRTEAVAGIVPIRGLVTKGTRIIAKGEVVEGEKKEKERIQAFEGIVISKHLSSSKIDSTITVRKMFQGGGTEKVFLLNSPWIKSIEVLSNSIVRRSKLYYLRERTGKSARLKRRL